MASKLGSVISDFVGDTTAHGIGRIQSSKPIWLKALWALIFCTSIGVFGWQLHGLLVYYYERPVSVKSSGIYESVKFPAVSFCNLNPIRNSQLHLGGERLTNTINEYTESVNNQLTGSVNSSSGSSRRKREVETDVQNHAEPHLNEDLDYTMQKLRNNFNRYYMNNGNVADKSVENTEATHSNGKNNDHSGGNGGDSSSLGSIVANNDKKLEILERMQFIQSYYGDSPEAKSRRKRSVNTTSSVTTTDSVTTTTTSPETTITAYLTSITTTSPTATSTTSSLNSTTTPMMTSLPVSTNASDFPELSDTTSRTVDTTTEADTTTSSTPTTTTTPLAAADVIQYDEADAYYVPDVDISNMPWFADTQGSSSAEASNTIKLTSALSSTPIAAKRAMGYKIEDMLQECTWNGIVCTPLNFTSFYDKTYGNCFTFNSGFNQTEVLKTNKPGSVYGLSMTIFIDQSEYIDTLAPSAGVRLLIHGQTKQPFPVDNGFTAIPGEKTSAQLTNRQFNLLPEPYGTCTKIGSTSEVLLYNKSYSQVACIKSCYQNRTLINCRCANPELSVPTNSIVCTENDTECIGTVKDRIANNEIICDCPLSCIDELYVPATSTSTWPGENFIRKIQQLFSQRTDVIGNAVDNASMISKNFLRVEVFYNELKYEQVVESPGYILTNLMSDIGGQLGLWLGFSMLTVVEFGQLLIELVTFPCRKKQEEQKVSNSVISVLEAPDVVNGEKPPVI